MMLQHCRQRCPTSDMRNRLRLPKSGPIGMATQTDKSMPVYHGAHFRRPMVWVIGGYQGLTLSFGGYVHPMAHPFDGAVPG